MQVYLKYSSESQVGVLGCNLLFWSRGMFGTSYHIVIVPVLRGSFNLKTITWQTLDVSTWIIYTAGTVLFTKHISHSLRGFKPYWRERHGGIVQWCLSHFSECAGALVLQCVRFPKHSSTNLQLTCLWGFLVYSSTPSGIHSSLGQMTLADCNNVQYFCHTLECKTRCFEKTQSSATESQRQRSCQEGQHITSAHAFLFCVTQGDSWALSYSVCTQLSSQSTLHQQTVEDLKTLITVYSTCSCECLITEVSKIWPLSNIITATVLSLSYRLKRI